MEKNIFQGEKEPLESENTDSMFPLDLSKTNSKESEEAMGDIQLQENLAAMSPPPPPPSTPINPMAAKKYLEENSQHINSKNQRISSLSTNILFGSIEHPHSSIKLTTLLQEASEKMKNIKSVSSSTKTVLAKNNKTAPNSTYTEKGTISLQKMLLHTTKSLATDLINNAETVTATTTGLSLNAFHSIQPIKVAIQREPEKRSYKYETLLAIRNKILVECALDVPYQNPKMIDCKTFELEARLRRFNIFKMVNNQHRMNVRIKLPDQNHYGNIKDSSIVKNKNRFTLNEPTLKNRLALRHLATRSFEVDKYKRSEASRSSKFLLSKRFETIDENQSNLEQSAIHNPNEEICLVKEPAIKNRTYTNELPEWYSCGPTSKLDTIELHGNEVRDPENFFVDVNKANRGSCTYDGSNNVMQIKKQHELLKKCPKKYGSASDFQFENLGTVPYVDRNSVRTSTQSTSTYNIHNRNANINGSKFLQFFDDSQDFAKNSNHNYDVDEKQVNFTNGEFKVSNVLSVNELEQKLRVSALRLQQHNRANSPFAIEEQENINNVSNTINKFMEHMRINSLHKIAKPDGSLAANAKNFLNIFKQQYQRYHERQHIIQQHQRAVLLSNLQLNIILNRPESQLLLSALARGNISKYGLLVQLSNSLLPQRDREAITAVLTFISSQQQSNSQQCSPIEKIQQNNTAVLNYFRNIQNLTMAQQNLKYQQQGFCMFDKHYTGFNKGNATSKIHPWQQNSFINQKQYSDMKKKSDFEANFPSQQ